MMSCRTVPGYFDSVVCDSWTLGRLNSGETRQRRVQQGRHAFAAIVFRLSAYPGRVDRRVEELEDVHVVGVAGQQYEISGGRILDQTDLTEDRGRGVWDLAMARLRSVRTLDRGTGVRKLANVDHAR
jgi:hypothetical protein